MTSRANIYAIPEKFFNVTGTKFYEYNDLQESNQKDSDELSITPQDAISLLYSNEDIDQYVTYPFAETNG